MPSSNTVIEAIASISFALKSLNILSCSLAFYAAVIFATRQFNPSSMRANEDNCLTLSPSANSIAPIPQ